MKSKTTVQAAALALILVSLYYMGCKPKGRV